MERIRTVSHVVAKGMRIGIGASIHDEGVTDVLVFGFDDWAPTEHRVTDDDEMFVVAVPFNIEGVRGLAAALTKIAHFLETGEVPEDAEPM